MSTARHCTMLLLFAAAAAAARGQPAAAPSVAYIVSSRVDREPILAYRGFGKGNADWQQVFNPTWVAPSPATGNRSGLLVRSQNCTPPPDAKAGSCGPTCSGTGEQASWLTFAELADDGGASSTPSVSKRVTAASAVWGPFDCQGWAPHAGGNGTVPAKDCIDARGTEDPRLTYGDWHGGCRRGTLVVPLGAAANEQIHPPCAQASMDVCTHTHALVWLGPINCHGTQAMACARRLCAHAQTRRRRSTR